MVSLRLISRDQKRALAESQLHEVVCRKYHEQVVTALAPLSGLYGADPSVGLGEVERVVAERLRSIDGLEAEIVDAVAAGGLSLDENELWLALACWVVENQLDGRPHWDPSRPPKL